MKLSEVNNKILFEYLRLDDEDEEGILEACFSASKEYIRSQTGLSDEQIDEKEDLTLAAMIITSDLYDNRSMTVDSTNINKTVSTILSMYTTASTLLGE